MKIMLVMIEYLTEGGESGQKLCILCFGFRTMEAATLMEWFLTNPSG
jgi:hypothetical protein